MLDQKWWLVGLIVICCLGMVVCISLLNLVADWRAGLLFASTWGLALVITRLWQKWRSK